MAFKAGDVFVQVGADFDNTGFQRFEKAAQDAENQARRKKIEVALGADFDESAFKAYERAIDSAAAKARRKDLLKAELGGDFDARAFNAYEREVAKAERSTRSFNEQTGRTRQSSSEANVSVRNLATSMRGLFDTAGKITALGIAAQGLSTLSAGAVAATSALAPLTGALGAVPALASAAGQGMGVFKLATSDVFQAVGGLNEDLDTSSKAFQRLSPEAQKFALRLQELKKPIQELGDVARDRMVPGFEKGITEASKNLEVLRKGVGDTADVLGELAKRAGELIGSRGFGRDLETQMRRNDTTIRRTGEGALNLSNALRDVVISAGPLVEWMTRMGVRLTEVIEKQARAGRESGVLAGFFDQTRIAMSRVIRIAADVGTALFNIVKAGRPLGDELLVSLTKNADKFREWTESARGQNAIADYFRQAKQPIYELSKLIEDVTKTFFRLGQGDQVAPLIRQIRTELLPVLEGVVQNTTRAFGPAFIRFLVEATKAFSTFAGTSGPLVAFTEALTTILKLFNRLVDRVPALGTALATLAAAGGIAKALGIASAITGIGRINTLLRGTAAAGAAAGAAPTAAAGGGLIGWLTKLPTPIRLVTAGLLAVGGVKVLQGFQNLGEEAKQVARHMDGFRASADRAARSGDPTRMRNAANQLRDISRYAKGAIPELDDMARALDRSARRADALARTVRDTNRQVSIQWRSMKITTDGNLSDIRRFVEATTNTIKERLTTRTAEGRKALKDNMDRAADAIRDAMNRGKISTDTGTSEIRKLMERGLRLMGLNATQAQAIVSHGTLQPSSQRTPGQGLAPGQRGGTAAMIAQGGRGVKREGGGWIGAPGMVGMDTVPAMLAPGEAVLNRHQQAVIEGILGGGFLDKLFASVDRPHYMARGGRAPAPDGVQRFAGGGFLQLPPSITPTHQTAGLAGYPAQDIFGSPGTRVGSPVSGTVARLSGQAGGPGGGGPYGYSVYINGDNGKSYFLTHFGSVSVRPGQKVSRGSMLGTIADYPGGVPDHIHEGIHGGLTAIIPGGPGGVSVIPALQQIRAPRTGVRGALGSMVQRALDVATAGGNAQLRRARDNMIANSGGTPGRHGPVMGQYSKAALASLWTNAGGPAGVANLMAAIALAESGGNPNAHNPSGATGLWQILGNPFPGNARDPQTNARMAVAKYRSQGLGAWEAYTNGSYRRYLARGGFVGRAVQRFASGGRVTFNSSNADQVRGGINSVSEWQSKFGSSRGGATSPVHIAGLERLQATRIGAFESVQNEIKTLQNQYAVQERAYNMTDEELVDPNTGAINMRGIFIRVSELNNLIEIAGKIFAAVQRAKDVAARILWSMGTILNRLRQSLWIATVKNSKDRGGILSQVQKYEGEFDQWKGTLDDLTQVDAPNRLLDIAALVQERDAVAGTQAQPNVDAAIPSDTGISNFTDTGGVDPATTGGGGGGGGGADETGPNRSEQIIQQMREADLQQAADAANRGRQVAEANLSVARGNLRALTGPGDIGFGAGTAFQAASFGSTPATFGTGSYQDQPRQVTIVNQVHSYVPPSGSQLVQMGQVTAAALDAQSYRTSTKTVLK